LGTRESGDKAPLNGNLLSPLVPTHLSQQLTSALRDYLDIFCTAYLDDILIYSNSLSEHKQHVRQILQRLRDFGLQADIGKCEFHVQEVKYLGLIVGTNGIRMDPSKISAVVDWPNVKYVQSFLGFANFYRRFIKDFAKTLTKLTRKDAPFVWDTACKEAFESLKEAFTSAPILQHFDPDKPSTIECDSSDYVNAGCLSQPDEEGILHPASVPDRDPASAVLDNLMLTGNIDTTKLIQKRFIEMKVICRATPARLHGPKSRCRRRRYGYVRCFDMRTDMYPTNRATYG
jgi:hypothetical protein